MTWLQDYDPQHNPILSTLAAAMPICVLMGLIASGKARIHHAAMLGLVASLAVATFAFHMPAVPAFAAAGYGALFGLLPIGWMILNLIFLYHLTVEKGWFESMRAEFIRVTPDPRIQLILIAFCFGAFFEGIAGFGTPVAVCSALLIQLGFRPLEACVLSLISNTAPVAFGSLGIPLVTLHQTTGLPLLELSQMAGRQLIPFCAIIPSWIIVAYGGWRAWRGVWPAAVLTGVTFSVVQFLMSNYQGPLLVDIVAALSSMAALLLLLRVWSPDAGWRSGGFTLPKWRKVWLAALVLGFIAFGVLELCYHGPLAHLVASVAAVAVILLTLLLIRMPALTPWIILVTFVFICSQKETQDYLNNLYLGKWSVPGLQNVVIRTPPVVPAGNTTPEEAIYKFNILSTVGTSILLAAILSGFIMGFTPVRLVRVWFQTLYKVRLSLLTIASMLALGYVTKFSGADATLGLSLAHTGWLYPFFGTLLGWLGVALTGSDTASNVLFGSLQTITAHQIGVSPVLMASANSVGGVMGKMVDAQSIVVASTATNFFGHESAILRRVFVHSLALAMLVGLEVFLQAYVWPFTEMVVK